MPTPPALSKSVALQSKLHTPARLFELENGAYVLISNPKYKGIDSLVEIAEPNSNSWKQLPLLKDTSNPFTSPHTGTHFWFDPSSGYDQFRLPSGCADCGGETQIHLMKIEGHKKIYSVKECLNEFLPAGATPTPVSNTIFTFKFNGKFPNFGSSSSLSSLSSDTPSSVDTPALSR